MRHWTLRGRLTIWSAVLFAGAIVLLGFSSVSLVRKHQIESLDKQLGEGARGIFHELAEHGPSGAAHGTLIVDKDTRAVVIGGDGQVAWSSPDLGGEDFAGAAPGAQTLGPWRVLSMTENGYTVRAARDFADVDATVADMRRAYLLALPLLLVLVAGGVWWLVNSALRPVGEISAAAQHITSEHLDERLPLPFRRDELGELTAVLNDMLERLERGHTQAVRFTADASHELMTPLALMAAGLEELLRRRDLTPEVVVTLGSLLDDNRRLAAVCQDLLILARADAGHLALDRRAHDLRALVDAAVEDARILAEGRGLAFDVTLPPRSEEFVDARYFTRILLNLLSNAVKYNCPGGRVRLRLAEVENAWVIDLANTGPGIESAHHAKLFERFFRVDNSAVLPGHGLGLSLSRELARAHGGDLLLDDSNAEWTTFRLTLPRTTLDPDQSGANQTSPLATKTWC